MARFNLHPDVFVQINIKNGRKMEQIETLDLYAKLLQEAEIKYDEKNHKRRLLIIKFEGIYYHVSVVGNEEYNSLIFTTIPEEYVNESIKEMEQLFVKESMVA